MADLTKAALRGEPPAWLRESESALLTHAQVMGYGSVRDMYLVPGPSGWSLPDIRGGVWSCPERAGHRFLVVADPVDGVQLLSHTPEITDLAQDVTGPRTGSGGRLGPERLLQVIRRVAEAGVRAGVMVDHAARPICAPRQLEPEDHHFRAACEKLAHTTRPGGASTCARAARSCSAGTRICARSRRRGSPSTTPSPGGTPPWASPRTAPAGSGTRASPTGPSWTAGDATPVSAVPCATARSYGVAARLGHRRAGAQDAGRSRRRRLT